MSPNIRRSDDISSEEAVLKGTSATPLPVYDTSSDRQSHRIDDGSITLDNPDPTSSVLEKTILPQAQYRRHIQQTPEDGLYGQSSEDTAPDELAHRVPVSRVTTDVDGNSYPEGGLKAWLVVLGSFLGLFASLGLVNTIGSFHAYLQTNQLKNYSSGSVSWIFGIYAFLTFFGGVQVGPVFDAKGPRLLIFGGSVLVMVMVVTMGFCTQYWHFVLSIGIAGGLGTSMIFTPAVSSIGHYFKERRGVATGIAATGGSVGGVVFPLILESLFPKIGWAWATRVIALICLVLVIGACLLIDSRLPKKPASKENVLPDFRIFRDLELTLTTAGIFFIEWGLFIPISYISAYALSHGTSEALSYQTLAFLNVGSVFGRAIPGFFADYSGRFNTLIVTVALCLVCNACLWLPAGDSVSVMIVYCVIFGFASGSNISLTPVCISQLCKIENYGRYYATSYTIVSFGTLTGMPIAGEILARCHGDYWGLITFTICCYAAGLICVTAAKLVHVGWRHPWAVY
ncbi:major facilitator superfamily domain-containing protein [Aspergillus cavernicola]|uniref:Major facilitator superfamily domain-containing protein n=1 Tax=Aspergillus cavernicola TaxID=176166 RepID=A0ABR4HGF3_9EURO